MQQQPQYPSPLDYNNLPYNEMNNYNDYPKGSNFNNQNNYNIPYNQNPVPHSQQFDYRGIGHNNEGNIQEYNKNNENVNQNWNHFVRQQLQSRGITTKPKSPLGILNHNQVDKERKRMLLDNIQTQISLTKNTKLQELQRKRDEDEQYLKDMMNSFPFGRGGGGAPVRDKNGQIVTTRRAWISDPKYNLVTINVDDDYNDVWGRDKKYGLVNFKNKMVNMVRGNPPGMNYNQMQIQNQAYQPMPQGSNMSFNQTIPQRRNFSARNPQPNNFTVDNQQRFEDPQVYGNNNNYQDQFQNFNQNENGQQYYDDQIQYQQQSPQQYIPPNNRPYSTNPQAMYPQQGQNYYQPQPQQQMPIIEGHEQQNPNNLPNDQTELNVSYDNYEWDEDKKKWTKELYKNDLLKQIKEHENRKWLEKQRKEREDAEEEARLLRENEEIERRLEEERRKTQKYQKDTTEQTGNIGDTRVKQRSNVVTIEKFDSNAVDRLNQQEVESRMALNNEIFKWRDQMQDQQNKWFSQINSLKEETQNANLQRFEALKEIEKWKDDWSKQRADEELRRKYVYDVIRDDNSKISHIYNHTHLPDNTMDKVIIPGTSHMNAYPEERMRAPNRIVPLPKIYKLDKDQIKTDSRFIDLDTHNIIDGLELYQNKDQIQAIPWGRDEEENMNNRTYNPIGGNYQALRSYYEDDINNGSTDKIVKDRIMKNDMDKKFNHDIKSSWKGNIEQIEDGQLHVNQIYNRNMERLRRWNDIEGKYFDQ